MDRLVAERLIVLNLVEKAMAENKPGFSADTSQRGGRDGFRNSRLDGRPTAESDWMMMIQAGMCWDVDYLSPFGVTGKKEEDGMEPLAEEGFAALGQLML